MNWRHVDLVGVASVIAATTLALWSAALVARIAHAEALVATSPDPRAAACLLLGRGCERCDSGARRR